jgi:hypothetical protein
MAALFIFAHPPTPLSFRSGARNLLFAGRQGKADSSLRFATVRNDKMEVGVNGYRL